MKTYPTPNRHQGRRRPIRVIVLHTMQAPEKLTTAEAVGRYFQNPDVRASSHVNVDPDSATRSVPDSDTAWAAPGCNADGLQLEMAGYAEQDAGGWADAASTAILKRSAGVVARWCQLHGVPPVHLTNAQLEAGHKGIIGHYQASEVYKRSTHWDPGPHFPWSRFLKLVRARMGDDTPPPDEEYDMDRLDLRNAHEKPVRGRHVDQLQALLMAAGYGPTGLVGPHGRPDGIGGRYTRAALGAFQVRTNTGTDKKPDYVAGPKSWAALLE